jgi:hypothetical protein
VSNRISINIGREDRYFLFINLSIQDLIELLEPDPSRTADELVLQFFASYPDYPVVRIRLRPGEAYIAPTENIIHDGMGSKTSPDMHLTICGHINFP